MTNKKSFKPFNNYKNLSLIHSIRYIDGFLRKLNVEFSVNDAIFKYVSKRCSAVVGIGGSLFMQQDNWRKIAKNYDETVTNSQNYYLLGCNFGPYKDEEFKTTYETIFNKMNDVCFRDQYSYTMFSHLSNVRIEADIVFGGNLAAPLETKNEIVISVIDLSWREKLNLFEQTYIEKMTQLSKFLVDNNFKVNLVSFCESQGDLKAINKIFQGLDPISKSHVSIIDYQGDLEKVLKVMNESKGIIGSRFHAMILGWKFQKPVIPIAYSNKTINVMNDLQYEGLSYEIETIINMDNLAILEQINRNKRVDISKAILSSNLQFRKLDDFINKL